MAAVMICLGKPGNEKGNDVLQLLDVLLSTETEVNEKRRILQEDFAIQMTQTLERKVSVMCNLSKGVWEKGVEKGREEGIEKGMKKVWKKVQLNLLWVLFEI